ncbi:hypothetical protein MMC24_007137 [Lignoscripta atroalba]|nr:hypothetical protein [Lignoscripta atroalba]
MDRVIRGLDDFLDFDSDAYYDEIQELDENKLRGEHALIQKKCLGAKASVGAGVVAAVHTSGGSFVLSGIGLRRNNYNEKKKAIIEARMHREGWPLVELRKRDILLAVGPTAIAACVAPGVDSLTGHFAGHAASSFTSHHVADTISYAVHDTSNFVHAAEQGFTAQVSAVTHGLAGTATQLVPVESVASNTTGFFGNMAGQAFASTIEISATKQAASGLARWGLGRGLDPAITPTRSTPTQHTRDNARSVPSEPRPSKLRDANTSFVDNTTSQSLDNGFDDKIDPVIVSLVILAPAIIYSIVGVKGLGVVSLASAIYCYTINRSISAWLKTTGFFTAIPLVAFVTGSRLFWFLTFAVQLCHAYGIFKRQESLQDTSWSLILALVAFSLNMCSNSVLDVLTTGMVTMCLVMAALQAIPTSSLQHRPRDTLSFVLYLAQRPDCLAVFQIPIFYYSTGNTFLLSAGCMFAVSIIYLLQSRTLPEAPRFYAVMLHRTRIWPSWAKFALVFAGVSVFVFASAHLSERDLGLIIVMLASLAFLDYRACA